MVDGQILKQAKARVAGYDGIEISVASDFEQMASNRQTGRPPY